jgi:hypothetical protein
VPTRALSTVCVEDLDTPVPRHQFSLGVIGSCLASVLCAGIPLQRVPAAMEMQGNWCGVPLAAASYYSVRLWLLRLGLYQLFRPKPQADDWMWIIDHTLQLGDRKCLVIVGLRQSAWEQAESRVLSHEDVDLIDLQPVTQSNGKVVYQQLKAAAAKTGVPRAIISDKGSDLHSGIALFRNRYRATVWIHDIKHKTACLLKQVLLSDRSWGKFTERAHRFKQQVSLSAWAALAPPQQRSKARYMNVDVLTDWAMRHLALLKSRKAIIQAGLKPAQVEEKLGWLRAFEPEIGRWGELLAVVEAAEHYIRHEGLHQDALTELEACMPMPATRTAQQMRRQLLEFVREQGQHAREGERLLGSSEVLESAIGKFKYLAGERGQHGMTGMVLSIGAFVGRQAISTVQTAMDEITTPEVWNWCRQHLGATVQSVRRRITQALSSGIEMPNINR